MTLIVREVDAATVRPLRHALLRAGRPIGESYYPTDDVAVHIAAYDEERIVGVATIFPDPEPDDPAAWRLRGMAVEPALQRSGVGTAVLQRAVNAVSERGVRTLWCKARVPAVGFYEHHGFTRESEPFEIPGIGPHVSMRLVIDQHSA